MNAAAIDCSAWPYENGALRVVKHMSGGSNLIWSSDCCRLHLDVGQMNGPRKQGSLLRASWEQYSVPVVNACVLDFFLAHSDQIPLQFESVTTFFWGTVYEFPVGGPHGVRYLSRHHGRWVSGIRWLVGFWGERDPALVWRSR